MKILSKIFGKKATKTPLEEFLGSITLEQARENYYSVKDESLKLPTALATFALHLSHRFVIGLRDMLNTLEKQIRITNADFPYDAVAFEAILYSYYWLMRDILNNDELEIDGDDEPYDENDYLECLKNSANIASSILDSEAQFDLSNTLMMNRIMAYSFEEVRNSVRPEEKFSQFLISSIQSRSPQIKSNVGLKSSMPLQLSVASYIPIFETAQLAQFKKTAKAMYLADREGEL